MERIFDDIELISVKITTHGLFTTDRYHMDRMIEDYADKPIPELLKIIGESFPEIDWSDIVRKIDCLFLLAEAHGFGY